MNRFIVALFIGDRFCQYKIDELIQNSVNGYIRENLVFGNKGIYFPLSIQGEGYCLQNRSSAYTVRCQNEDVTEGRVLQHGDYFMIQKGELVYSALIVDYSYAGISCKVCRIGEENVFLGRAAEMNIVLDINPGVSRKCAAIRAEGSGVHYIEDLSGKTGVYVNGCRATSQKLRAGDEIYIMGHTIVYYPTFLLVPAHVATNLGNVVVFDCLSPLPVKEQDVYVRTPRIVKSEERGQIVIDTPPAPHKSKDMPFILTVGPSLTMSLAMLASLGVTISNALNGGSTGSLIASAVMAVSMLAGALLWPTLMRRYNRKQEEKNEQYRRERYSAYLAEKEAEIKSKYDRNARVLHENLMPSPAALASFVEEKSRRLWERTPRDADFLNLRLGIGKTGFAVEIQSPHKGFALEDDPMLDAAIALRDKYAVMTDVPISLSLLDKRVVGVVGATMDVLKVVVTNIISLHSPDEVKLVFIYNAADIHQLRWANDLPHTWSNDKKQRYVATNRAEAKTLLSALDETITERESILQKDEPRTPHYVFLVLDEQLIEDIPFCRFLINGENTCGISTVFFGRHFQNIPKECVGIIQKDQDVCGVYLKNENNNRFISYRSDTVSDELIDRIAKGIAEIPVKTEKGRASIPDRVNFLDMYRVGNVDALEITSHWKTNLSEKSLAAPIGIKAGGEVFELDIHEKYHGCHGLVAGTTGSGKSEFLQAYILSMMIHYSPSEVAFVLVDFKGGDMARPFLKSPHLAATISNLSGNTLYRALLSLEAEVKSRQNIFNQSAELLCVDKIDINSYHKYFKDKKLTLPLPHLIIVIDEFAQLKSQHPEFMSKLIDIAQVGRSLGIHLILATQRPSGVIDPQIWSNSKFKVCLKVLDKQDSMDMINHPEAALIKQPGRAYVQVGYDEIFEQIQSGYSGADYVEQAQYVDEDSISVNLVNWPGEKIRTVRQATQDKKTDRTQLEEIVSAITAIGEAGCLQAKKLWLPPLPTTLLLEQCGGFDPTVQERWARTDFGEVICGIADLPEIQEQRPFGFDFLKNGHLAIYGSSGTGKSTLIQTILFSLSVTYSPAMLHTFVLDFDGNSLASVAAMPHCARYVTDSDDRAVEEVLRTVQAIMAERQEIFAKHHCANYASYISSTNEKMPMLLLVLDNYAAFREKMYKCEDLLIQIIAAARSCGIYLIVTGNSKGAIYYKVTEQIPNKVVLNMNDSGAYRDILTVSVPILPEQAKGRALTLVDKRAVEVQFAVPFDAENEAIRTAQIHDIYTAMRAHAEGVVYQHSEPQANDPDEEAWAPPTVYEPKMEALEPLGEGKTLLALGTDIITGERRGFDLSAVKKVFIGTRGQKQITRDLVRRLADTCEKRICYISSSDADLRDAQVEIVSDVDAFVLEYVAMDAPSRGNVVVVIDGFCDFFDRISDDALFCLERLLKEDADVLILTLDPMQRLNDYRDTGLYVHLVRTACGAVVGGGMDDAVASAITTDIYEVSRTFREKKLKPTQATVYRGKKIAYVDMEGG